MKPLVRHKTAPPGLQSARGGWDLLQEGVEPLTAFDLLARGFVDLCAKPSETRHFFVLREFQLQRLHDGFHCWFLRR